MRILGIETSCDETAAAVVENGPSTSLDSELDSRSSGLRILSNVVASSIEFHKKTGGIIPEVAAREQVRCIIPVIKEAIKQFNNLTIDNIDALAVTIGPGLIGSLLVGVETAKTLAYVWKKPIVPVNHLQAHLYANWLELEQESERVKEQELPGFPAIGLVVSGGHTDLVLMKTHGKIKWLGGTRDDASGECFDKCARLLGLGYPGGPAISAAAEKLKVKNEKLKIKLPRPMIDGENLDFSFSGLKTAVIQEVAKVSKVSKVSQVISELAYEIQEAITDVLVAKTIRAAEKYKVKSILLAGGVAANQRLREKFSLHPLITNYPACAEASAGRQLLIPPSSLCTDNAAIIASCAYFNYQPINWQKIEVNPGLGIAEL